MMSSCASILNGKQQKVSVLTKSSKSMVYLNGEETGKGKSVLAEMPRNAKVQQVKIETEGYKDQYVIHYQDRKSPLYIMSWIPFGITFYVPFMDIGPKSFNYDKTLAVKEKLIPISEREENDKYVFLKNTAFDLDENDLEVKKIKHSQLKKNKKKYKDISSNTEKIKFDNSIFTSSLNSILHRYHYTDTTQTFFKNKNNTIYIVANVSKLRLNHVYQKGARTIQDFLNADISIEWDVQDIYGQSKYKKVVKGKSGEFSYDYNKEKAMINCVEDAISASFLTFFGNKNVRAFLKTGVVEKIKLKTLALNSGNQPSSVSEAMNASVTIKTDLGHGSGLAVSKDGHILTNFHVISGAEKIEIMLKTGEVFKAEIVRKSEDLDVALIKADTTFDKVFNLKSNNYEMGEDIFVIGTPNSIELGQTISKGIISGERKIEDSKNYYIQTDASINPGNSGGPLINKKGKLIGVVNAKISGLGVEGLGFAIPMNLVLEALSIKN